MKTLFLLFLAVPVMAGGPKFAYDDPKLNAEIDNIYSDIRAVLKGTIRASSMSVTNLTAGTFPGRIKQIVQVNDATGQTTTSATFVDTRLVLSITPTSATNKVLLLGCGSIDQPAAQTCAAGIFRGTSNLGNATYGMVRQFTGGSLRVAIPTCMAYLDSPATTSATTYSIKFKTDGGTCGFGLGEYDTLLAMEYEP